MKFTEATNKDSREISLLMSKLAEKYIAPDCTTEGVKILLNSMNKSSIERYLSEGYRYYVAKDSHTIVGVIGMKNNTEIYHLFTSETHQGQGISRRLWELAKNNCLRSGNKGFFTVQSAINAKIVYLQFGFLPTDGVAINSGIKEIPMELYC
jgi:GNAT superfamily N-acetyltransferase